MIHKATSNRFMNVLILHCIIILSDLSFPSSAYLTSPSTSSVHHQWRSSSSSSCNCMTDADLQKRFQVSIRPDFRPSNARLWMNRRDPNDDKEQPSSSSSTSRRRILRSILSSPLQKLRSTRELIVRFKWTTMVVLVLLGSRLLLSTPDAPTTTTTPTPKQVLLLAVSILMDIGIKVRRVKNWEQYLSSGGKKNDGNGDNNNNNSWTPSAQSKSRLFWNVPLKSISTNRKQREQQQESDDDNRNSIYKRRSFQNWTSSEMGQKLLTWIFGLNKILRYMLEKTTVYVLECENDKYYVGSTVNLKRRMKQHFHNSRSGSVWTKKHKPIRVLRIYRRIPYKYKLGFESQVTAELMWEKGINNVRGAMYLYARDYSTQDINSLVSFIGHYNDLSYRYVRNRLVKELKSSEQDAASSSSTARSRRREKRKTLRKEYRNKMQAVKNRDLTITTKAASIAQNNSQDTDDTGDDPYKAMDEWLNRKTLDETSSSSSNMENNTTNDDEPKTIDDL